MGAPAWIRQLVLSADQFVVRRPLPDDPDGMSVIAGYHWFGDWGRDTVISLPGLVIATGRPEIGRRILSTFARFVDRGMLPNRFPDAREAPEYNTVPTPAPTAARAPWDTNGAPGARPHSPSSPQGRTAVDITDSHDAVLQKRGEGVHERDHQVDGEDERWHRGS
jgi:Amylo-alpha-1,6-glucosidase